MVAKASTNPFGIAASKYFSRTSFMNPVFVGQEHVAFLHDEAGTKQLAQITLSTQKITNDTAYEEGLMSLLGSYSSGRIVFGMDSSGNERQQLY